MEEEYLLQCGIISGRIDVSTKDDHVGEYVSQNVKGEWKRPPWKLWQLNEFVSSRLVASRTIFCQHVIHRPTLSA